MVADSILGLTDSVIISTSGHHVILDMSFSRPISAVEFIPTCFQFMSQSRYVPSNIPILAALDISFRAINETNVLMTTNEEFHHRVHRHTHCCQTTALHCVRICRVVPDMFWKLAAFDSMGTDDNELQVQDCPGECR